MEHWFYISTKDPRPLIGFELPHTYLSIFSSEIIGLFELEFHMEYSVIKQYKYDICFRSLGQNGHHAHT